MLTAKRIVAVAAMLTLLTSVVLAKEEGNSMGKGDKVKIEGTVNATKDASGNIQSVQVVSQGTTYNVTMDKKGMELGEKMNGKVADVRGRVTETAGQKWLDVSSYNKGDQD